MFVINNNFRNFPECMLNRVNDARQSYLTEVDGTESFLK